ncbi:MAG: NUDIX domain-containing protein [Actinomyces sp.]|uniref:NUDIX hydrolase n=1 Tax=Actinomyces sp. TaxID=29317 RepID=UPI0026DC44C7|nr:NUDIX domain-containing protein [Actinomyces sp.]MDO4244038.1 NUDIX domain-containing protein [Actinomyces sp.]
MSSATGRLSAPLTADGRHPELVPADWAQRIDPGEWALGPEGLPSRRAGRVLVITVGGDALLLTGHDADDPSHSWVFTPGGGIRSGEDSRAAAARELAEETGIVVDPAGLVGPIAWRDAVFRFSAVLCRQQEDFFLLLLDERVLPVRDGWTDLEREVVDAVDWWTPGQLDAAVGAGTTVYPGAMPGLVRTLSRGWDGRPIDLTEPEDAAFIARIGAGVPASPRT